jgi:hypothetical protein
MIEKRDCTVFYSCSNNKHQFGTRFIANKKVKHLVIGFTPVNERISCLCIRHRFFNSRVINTHTPTEEKPDAEKEALEKKIYTIQLLESIVYITTVMTLA